MNISYYALSNMNDLMKQAGFTMVMMNHGEIGFMTFNSRKESIQHNDSCFTLKRDIAAFNKGFEVGNVRKNEYYENVAKWCSNVEQFANKWSPNRVPFDIRDAYNDCITNIGRTRIITWPNKVPIPSSELSDETKNQIICSYSEI